MRWAYFFEFLDLFLLLFSKTKPTHLKIYIIICVLKSSTIIIWGELIRKGPEERRGRCLLSISAIKVWNATAKGRKASGQGSVHATLLIVTDGSPRNAGQNRTWVCGAKYMSKINGRLVCHTRRPGRLSNWCLVIILLLHLSDDVITAPK